MTLRWRIQPREYGKAFLVVECERGVNHGRGVPECKRSLWMGEPVEGVMWRWDGRLDAPTIVPSVACGLGCNRHFTITAGVTAETP